MLKDKININTIAEEAGVSPSTVSRVMRNNAYVSPEKKASVEAAIRKYNYKPNVIAQGLRGVNTKVLGIMAVHIDSPFYSKLTAECERIANERGYMLMISSSLSDYELEKKQIIKLYEQRVDGIIILGGSVEKVTVDEEYRELINKISETIPIVATGRQRGTNCYKVGMDERYAMKLAMEYLIGLGHTKIALMGGDREMKPTLDKYQEYERLIREKGLVQREEYVLEIYDYNFESGYANSNKLDVPDPATAVIAINDAVAAGIMKAALENGQRIPEALSVISFDNTYLSQIATPPLTSVACDYREFAATLIDTAIDAAEGRDVPEEQVVKVSLIIRSSCRQLK